VDNAQMKIANNTSHEVAQMAAVQQLLIRLEGELKATGLWNTVVPSAEALASDTPFCIDTLRFSDWLQFVFLVKMQYILDNKLTLPQSMAISPMAEEAFNTEPKPTQDLLLLLIKFDSLFTD